MVLGFVGNVLHATAKDRQLVYVSRHFKPQPKEKTSDRWNLVEEDIPLSGEFERSFAYPVKGDTMCEDWNLTCPSDAACMGPAWRGVSLKMLDTLKTLRLAYFLGARVEMSRFFLRLNRVARQDVDRLFDAIWSSVSEYTIGIHLRRGDKKKETKPTEEKHYVKAAIQLMRDHPPVDSSKTVTVVVTTDDSAAARSLQSCWKAMIPTREVRFIIRAEAAGKIRPDKLSQTNHEMVHSSTMDLLTDFKLMASANYFIGTASSNMGLIICYLRGGHGCYNAEARRFPYEWGHLSDKMSL